MLSCIQTNAKSKSRKVWNDYYEGGILNDILLKIEVLMLLFILFLRPIKRHMQRTIQTNAEHMKRVSRDTQINWIP